MTQTKATSRPPLLTGLTVLSAIMFVTGLIMALFWAPTDPQGDIQRIFYLHLGAFIAASVTFFITLVAAILYLVKRNLRYDQIALAGVEVGLVLAGFNLVSGMIWARPIWNTWWTWDPRLTSAAVMWLTYAAYMMLRNGIDDMDRRARFASVYGILAYGTVIFTFLITRVRPDTIHPTVIGPSPQNAEGSFEIDDSRMTITLMFNMVTYLTIAITLIWHRFRLERLSQQVQRLKMQVLSR